MTLETSLASPPWSHQSYHHRPGLASFFEVVIWFSRQVLMEWVFQQIDDRLRSVCVEITDIAVRVKDHMLICQGLRRFVRMMLCRGRCGGEEVLGPRAIGTSLCKGQRCIEHTPPMQTPPAFFVAGNVDF